MPAATLQILGGDEHPQYTRGAAAFAQAGVDVLGHRDDVPDLLGASTLTINPQQSIRGSAVKLVESLAAGRVCISTTAGARGFAAAAPAGLVTVPDVAAMAEPIVALLADASRRHAPRGARGRRARRVRVGTQRRAPKALYDALLRAPAP